MPGRCRCLISIANSAGSGRLFRANSAGWPWSPTRRKAGLRFSARQAGSRSRRFSSFNGPQRHGARDEDDSRQSGEIRRAGAGPRASARDAASPAPKSMTVTLAFIGDVMLGRLVSREIERKQPPESFWGDTLSVLKRADAVFANLECAVTPCKQKWNRTRKVFHFGAAPEAIEVLKAGNVRYVSLANNHILDFQEQGLFDTLKYLEQAGIHSAGAGRNLEEAMRPALINIPMGPGQSLKI